MLSEKMAFDFEQYVAESSKVVAGHAMFLVGLCQLHAKQFCMQLTKAEEAETSCNLC